MSNAVLKVLVDVSRHLLTLSKPESRNYTRSTLKTDAKAGDAKPTSFFSEPSSL